MKDRKVLLASFEASASLARMLSLFSGGVIVVTMAVVFQEREQGIEHAFLAIIAWSASGLAIVLGLLFFGGQIAVFNFGRNDRLDMYQPLLRFLAFAQLIAFGAGLGAGIAFKITNL